MPNHPDFDGPRLLHWTEDAAARRLSQICFGDEDAGQEPEAPRAGDAPTTRPPRRARYVSSGETWVIAAEGRPVSMISTFHERLRTFDGLIRVGSIGGVCTHPDYRGHRLASRLLEHCTGRLAEGGAALMLISGGRGLYTRAGCAPCGLHACFTLQAGQADLPTRGATLRPLTRADALAGSRLYQASPAHFERRLGQYAASFDRPPGGYHAEQWMVKLGGRPAATLLMTVPWDYAGQPELGFREVYEYAGSPLALAGGLAAALREPGIREIRAAVAWQDAGLIDLLAEAGLRPEWSALPDHTMRIIDFPGLMAGLRPYLRARLEPRLLRGLRFEQSGPLLGGSGGDVLAITRGTDRLALDGAAMTRLVMGSPDGPAAGDLQAPPALKEAAQALFPLPAFLPGLSYH